METKTIKTWLELITEHSSSAILVLDKEKNICYANKAAVVLGGVADAENLLGQSYHDILSQTQIYDEYGAEVGPDEFPSNLVFAHGVEIRGRVFQQTNPLTGHRWLSISSFPLINEGEEVEYVALFFDDITERKHREDQLQFLVESSNILSITQDFTTRLVEKARLLVPSLADWCTLNVMAEDGSLKRITTVHRDPAKKALVEEMATLSAQDRTARSGVWGVVHSGKSQFFPSFSRDYFASNNTRPERVTELATLLQPSSAMIVPILSDTKVVGVLSLAYSDSKRKFTAEDVIFMEEFGHHLSVVVDNANLYEEIRKRDEAKDNFLAALSHELRNPLAPIKHALELIHLKNKDTNLVEEIHTIDHQFTHLTELLKDLLDVNRFTHGKISLEKSRSDMRELISNVAIANRPFMAQKHIHFGVQMPEQPVWAEVDSLRFEQVLTNLLHNSEKFTPTGGTIRIELTTEGPEAVIIVQDSGIGIPKGDLDKIFNLYFQSKTPDTNRRSQGLGMGLLLVREIMHLHQGTVTAYSEGKDKGSTFTLRVPILLEDTESPPLSPDTDSSTAHKQLEPRTVLVVDDNESAADSLVNLLNAIGLTAYATYSGADGITQHNTLHPDVMIIDIGMAGMDGYHVAQKLRNEFDARIPLIALTGYGLEEDQQRAFESGFDFHLTKPIGLTEIREVLEKLPIRKATPR